MTTFFVQENGEFRAADGAEVMRSAQAILSQRIRKGMPVLRRPNDVREFLRLKLASLEIEVFAALYLDGRARLIEYIELFRGSFNTSVAHPREVLKEALRLNAAALILVHNHPSGDCAPSQADELVTTKIREALALVEIRVVDHLIVGEDIYSFAENERL